MKAVLACLSVSLLAVTVCQGERDNFDDGDTAGWTRVDPLAGAGVAAPVSYTFPDGAVRLRGSVPAVDAAGPARVFLFHGGDYTDFYVAVDVLAWDDTIDQAFGILARAGAVGLGTTTGYVCNYNPNQTDSAPGGQFQINRVTGEAEDGTLAAANVKLVAGRAYRFVFTGLGDVLEGAVYDREDLSVAIARIRTEDGATYDRGGVGLFNFFRGDATDAAGIPDATFDNFEALATAPPIPDGGAAARGIDGALQVVEREPGTGELYHDAGDGIDFRVVRDGGAPVGDVPVSVVVNGVEVGDQVQVSEDRGVMIVNYHGLEPNRAYEVRVEVGGAVDAFGFATFELSQLADGTLRQVEAEDYDYGGGGFQDDPPPSGFGDAGQVNGEGVGYLDQEGVLGEDYEDFGGAVVDGNDYRFFDFVGLRAGSDDVEPSPTGELVSDDLRPKYVDAGVPDYEVFETEAGEWLNYTRTWAGGEYRVYLRVASRAAQDVILQDVGGGGAVSEIGRFRVPNLVSPQRYRFVPLTGAGGEPLVVAFDGQKTLRLLMGGEAFDFETMHTLYMNYLLFVPEGGGAIEAPRITGVLRGENAITFSWTTEVGASYRVEYSATAREGTWVEIDDIEAAGVEASYTDSDLARLWAGEGFYRVRRVE